MNRWQLTGSLLLIVANCVGARADMVTLTGAQIEEAMLVQENPNDNFGGRTNFEVGVIGNGGVRTTVMRFDVTDPGLGLFQGGVPQFDQINSITLKLTALSDTVGGNTNTGNSMDLRIAANQEAQGDWVEGTGTGAASGGDAGTVTYSERREGQGTPWLPNTNYTRGTGDGILGTETVYPGDGISFEIELAPLPGEDLNDLILRWATGNNEGVLINEFNRPVNVFARWILASSENGTLANRPMLTIDFTPVPEATSIAVWSLLALGLCGAAYRRRRGR